MLVEASRQVVRICSGYDPGGGREGSRRGHSVSQAPVRESVNEENKLKLPYLAPLSFKV